MFKNNKKDTIRKSVEDMEKYYKEFHHKCISWYITIMGFFIAGVMATKDDPQNAYVYIFPLLIFAFIIYCFFQYFLLYYASRIKNLKEYLDSEDIPVDWRKSHRKVSLGIHGKGDVLFILILLSMFFTLVITSVLKFSLYNYLIKFFCS